VDHPTSRPHTGLVFVPAHPDVRPGQRNVMFETRRREDGTAVAVAYTSQRRLVDACGRAQPWVCLPLAQLESIMSAAGIATIEVDPEHGSDLSWDEDGLAAVVAALRSAHQSTGEPGAAGRTGGSR
jgi:hypothetical protein